MLVLLRAMQYDRQSSVVLVNRGSDFQTSRGCIQWNRQEVKVTITMIGCSVVNKN